MTLPIRPATKEEAILGTHPGFVDLMYPPINKEIAFVRISLYHVRAAPDILIGYDGERDGWVIMEDDLEEGPREIRFLQSWEDIDKEEE